MKRHSSCCDRSTDEDGKSWAPGLEKKKKKEGHKPMAMEFQHT